MEEKQKNTRPRLREMKTLKIGDEMKESMSAENEERKQAKNGASNKFGGKSVPVVAS